ncbi:hypothetical protein C2E23DRAFT_867869 [Lenzites betulinus]|nr:hypothetical protein C2E23DRAFT_867869 [Lenzites betulinus]
MVARCRAKTCIVHLRADKESEDSPVLPSNQRGIKGHVIIHPQRPEKLSLLLPPSTEEVMAPICVIFVGSTKPTRAWLEKKAKPLVVRRERVLNALQWLKVNNPLYADVEINMECIRILPENGILPHKIQHIPSADSASSVTDAYDQPLREADDVPSTRDINRESVAFSKVVITDVDGRAPASELRAAAIRHIKQKGGGYVEVPHLPKPVNEFCNPTLFPMIYPSLYPYGIGGFEDSNRKRALSLKRHVKHAAELCC